MEISNIIMAIILSMCLKSSALHGRSDRNEPSRDEMRLVRDLLENYEREVRPVKDKKKPVTIKFGMAYTQLLDLDEKNQVLVSNVWIRMEWWNLLLTWNKSEYDNITEVNLDPQNVWLPDIVLFNNADKKLASAQMDQFETKVMLRNDGLTKWYSPTLLKSRCEIDIEFFPFDDQKCVLKFLSWTYDGLRVNMTVAGDTADMTAYMESGEFLLISTKADRKETYYSCCVEPYPVITFTLHLRRKTLFYVNNLIVPCALITLLALLTFLLPPCTGERITLGITTLLSMTVLMLQISERTPSTSTATPLIGKFFIVSMVIIGSSIISTSISLNLYECARSPKTVPRFMRVITIRYLARILFVPTNHVFNEKFDEDEDDKIALTNTFDTRREKEALINSFALPPDISRGIALLGEVARQKKDIEKKVQEWQVVGRVIDRFFFALFSFTIASASCYIFINRP